jgi:HEPN domain-containing protein
MKNRSSNWLHQAQADLELAEVSAAAGHHEWACFACHQTVEKALTGLHLRHDRRPAAGGPLVVAAQVSSRWAQHTS